MTEQTKDIVDRRIRSVFGVLGAVSIIGSLLGFGIGYILLDMITIKTGLFFTVYSIIVGLIGLGIAHTEEPKKAA